MKRYKILVLTDHTNHSAENSIYGMLQSMRNHPRCAQIDIATRGNSINDFFFKKLIAKSIFVHQVDESFAFSVDGKFFKKRIRRESLYSYDAIWLRLPPPIPKSFLFFLKDKFPNQIFINDPKGIYLAGSKNFLLNFPSLCAPMKLCCSVEDILEFAGRFPIVLKPLREYGGKGIVKIDGGRVWQGNAETSLETFLSQLNRKEIEYLGVKFLANVSKGDKRIVVVNGKIIGASLRVPAKDSWLCNVAMGGKSLMANVEEEELKIVEQINPKLNRMGIVMYGVDTLVNDDGKRVLSEINTTSIGGVVQMERQQGKPLVQATTNQIWDFIIKKIKEQDVISN